MTAIAAGKRSGKMVMLPGGYIARTRGRWLELTPENASDDCPYPSLSRDFRITLPWGPIAVGVTKQDGWEVTARAARLAPDASLDTGEPMAAYLSPAALAEGANVRTWRPGDRIQPLGMSGTRKLQDVFTDAGVPRTWRDRVPLVVTPRGIAWAVGVRIADWAALSPSDGDERPATLVRFELVGN
jgi:tRNA(Ile)-lysidine synthase